MLGPKYAENYIPLQANKIECDHSHTQIMPVLGKEISASDSLCEECMSKYKIKRYNYGNDGCGCDRQFLQFICLMFQPTLGWLGSNRELKISYIAINI